MVTHKVSFSWLLEEDSALEEGEEGAKELPLSALSEEETEEPLSVWEDPPVEDPFWLSSLPELEEFSISTAGGGPEGEETSEEALLLSD